MASGDLILSSGTVITAAEIQQIAAEVKKELAAESKELADFAEVSSLTGVSSLPGIQQSGTTMRLVRVAMSVLKGVNGRDIELSASSTAIRWRYVGDEAWNTLVDLSLLKGNKGDPGDPVVLRKGDTGIEWKLQSEPDTAYRTLVAVADLRFSFSDLTDEEKGEITKIPILSEVSATPGTEPSGAFVSAGRDTDGNPVYTLSLVVPRGERGLPPVIEMGTVTTILPDAEASATLVENGETDEGNPRYLLNLNIPAGRPGQDGDGAGNVYINEAETMESGKLYLFQPAANGMKPLTLDEYKATRQAILQRAALRMQGLPSVDAQGNPLDKDLFLVELIMAENSSFASNYSSGRFSLPTSKFLKTSAGTINLSSWTGSNYDGNPNGFKFGSAYSDSNSTRTVKNCLTFDHGKKGFDNNNSALKGSFTNCVAFDNGYNYYLPNYNLSKWSSIIGFDGNSSDKLPGGYSASAPGSSQENSIRSKVESTRKSIVSKCNSNIIPGEVYFDIF